MLQSNDNTLLKTTIIPERKISNASLISHSSSAASCSDSYYSNYSNISATSNLSSSPSSCCCCCSCNSTEQQQQQQTLAYLSPNHHHHQLRHHHHHHHHHHNQRNNNQHLKVPTNPISIPLIIKEREIYSTPSSPIPDQISNWIQQQQHKLTDNVFLDVPGINKCSNCKYSKSVPDFSDNLKLRIKSSKDICGTVDKQNRISNQNNNMCSCKTNQQQQQQQQQRSKSEIFLKSSPKNVLTVSGCQTPSSDYIFFSNQNKLHSVSNELLGNNYIITPCGSYCSVCDTTPNQQQKCCCEYDTQISSFSFTSLPEFTNLLSHVDSEAKTTLVEATPVKENKKTVKLKIDKKYDGFYIESELSSSSNSQVTSGCDLLSKYFDSTLATKIEDKKSSSKKSTQNLTTKLTSKLSKFVNFHVTSKPTAKETFDKKTEDFVKKLDDFKFDSNTTKAVNSYATLRNYSTNALNKYENKNMKIDVSSDMSMRFGLARSSKKNSKSTSDLDLLKVVNKIGINEICVKNKQQVENNYQHYHHHHHYHIGNKKKLNRPQKSATTNLFDDKHGKSRATTM
jgi:hypothetical protein